MLTDDEIEEFLQGFLQSVDSENEEDAEEQGAEKVARGEEVPENPGRVKPAGRGSGPVEEGEHPSTSLCLAMKGTLHERSRLGG